MPRFVLLRHECPPGYEKPSHWDFMLEQNGRLKTWELRELPAAWAQQLGLPEAVTAEAVPAVPLPDHRMEYLDYEGPLTGSRGDVRRCDDGLYEIVNQDESVLEISLLGVALHGTAKLTKGATNWQLAIEP